MGINAKHGEEILIADNPSAFADAVLDLLMNEVQRETVAGRARKFVEDHYSWEKNLSTLERAINFATLAHKPPVETSIPVLSV